MKLLYKYLSAERVDVLESERVRFTQPAAFNDPFEARPFIEGVAKGRELDEAVDRALDAEINTLWKRLPPQDRRKLTLDEYRELLDEHRPRLRTEMADRQPEMGQELREQIYAEANRTLGVLSLTEHPDNLLMWSHYANSHEGIVLGLDASAPWFIDDRIHDSLRGLRKIDYRSLRPRATANSLTMMEVLFTKSLDWRYEDEWRAVRRIDDAFQVASDTEHPVCLVPLPSHIVREVILGARIGDGTRERVLAALARSGYSEVRVLEASMDEQEFKLNLNEAAQGEAGPSHGGGSEACGNPKS